MTPGAQHKDLLPGRGLVLIDDFLRASGVDRDSVTGLVADGRLQVATGRDGRVVGLFTDQLPSREQLQAWGVVVRGDYDPEALRGCEGEDGDTDGTEGPTWTMTWGEPGPS